MTTKAYTSMSEKQEPQKTPQERLEEQFAATRREFTNEIMTASQMLKDMSKLVSATVIFLSLRQRLLEENHKIIANHDKQAKKHRETKAEKLLDASTNMNVRFNEREKDKFIDGQLPVSNIKAVMDFLQNQSNYLAESIKTVDHSLYNIKVVLDMQKMLRGE